MRYHYATLHQCDSCGVTALVPEPTDLRKLDHDPRPSGWGPPVGTQFVQYDNRNGERITLNDICPDCMQLPLTTLIKMATDKVTAGV